jgi:hypothetical protein
MPSRKAFKTRQEIIRVLICTAAMAGVAHVARAQDPSSPALAESSPSALDDVALLPVETDAAADIPNANLPPAEMPARSSRIFGVLPNYASVAPGAPVSRVTTKQTFQLAALNSFDPYVFPFVGVVAGVAQIQNKEPQWGQGVSGYARRYGLAFADNTLGNVMTTAVVPSLVGQDPRYFELGEGGVLRRALYAADRSVVIRTRAGKSEFNVSEIGGNALAATVANVYYPRESRTVSDTLGRWGMQVMWDTLSNELKEFWPDLRNKFHKS